MVMGVQPATAFSHSVQPFFDTMCAEVVSAPTQCSSFLADIWSMTNTDLVVLKRLTSADI